MVERPSCKIFCIKNDMIGNKKIKSEFIFHCPSTDLDSVKTALTLLDPIFIVNSGDYYFVAYEKRGMILKTKKALRQNRIIIDKNFKYGNYYSFWLTDLVITIGNITISAKN